MMNLAAPRLPALAAAVVLVTALMASGVLHIRPGDMALGTDTTYCGIAAGSVSVEAYCQSGH